MEFIFPYKLIPVNLIIEDYLGARQGEYRIHALTSFKIYIIIIKYCMDFVNGK